MFSETSNQGFKLIIINSPAEMLKPAQIRLFSYHTYILHLTKAGLAPFCSGWTEDSPKSGNVR